jgi:AmiR/NasT family two-component response regulator
MNPKRVMDSEAPEPLRVLVADERTERAAEVIQAVVTLGHEIVARRTTLDQVGPVTAAERPDVAVVIVEEASDHALALIGAIVHEAACPVIAILDVEDRGFINEAAKRGIFAYIADGRDPEELQSSIDIALRRFAEYHNLEGAFGRRAVTERAKGILMERHSIDEGQAFNMLRAWARKTNCKVVDVAEAIATSHQLLPPDPARHPLSDETSSGRRLTT